MYIEMRSIFALFSYCEGVMRALPGQCAGASSRRWHGTRTQGCSPGAPGRLGDSELLSRSSGGVWGARRQLSRSSGASGGLRAALQELRGRLGGSETALQELRECLG